jgi:hypothetical protein
VSTRDEYEAALRALPEAHSLALRLHDAGVADEVICGYLHIEAEGLAGQKATRSEEGLSGVTVMPPISRGRKAAFGSPDCGQGQQRSVTACPSVVRADPIALPAHRNLPSVGFNPSFVHRLWSGTDDEQQESMSIPEC